MEGETHFVKNVEGETQKVGCELPMLAEWFPMTLRMRMRLIMGMGVKKAMQSPIPISHPDPVLLSKFLNFCWAWWAHCVSR